MWWVWKFEIFKKKIFLGEHQRIQGQNIVGKQKKIFSWQIWSFGIGRCELSFAPGRVRMCRQIGNGPGFGIVRPKILKKNNFWLFFVDTSLMWTNMWKLFYYWMSMWFWCSMVDDCQQKKFVISFPFLINNKLDIIAWFEIL